MKYRIGQGFDVHAFDTDSKKDAVILGGISIAHPYGLAGHSDADVVLHALTDALLGTIAAGDIGVLFPPSDPQWKGAASYIFVRDALRRIHEKHGTLENIDITIICEAPKITPHRDSMQRNIASLLGLALDQVNIKATTTEQLGFTGRGEGIAAQAIALISLP